MFLRINYTKKMLAKLLLLFNASQKLLPAKFLYAVHQNAEKPYRDIIKFHGFKLASGVVTDYIKMCERANQDDKSDVKKAKKKYGNTATERKRNNQAATMNGRSGQGKPGKKRTMKITITNCTGPMRPTT